MAPVPGEQLQVAVEGGALAVERWPGTGPTVVLLHAGVSDRRGWRATVESGLVHAARVVAYDRRGFGDSPPSASPYRDLDDLLAVLDALVDGPAWLVGSSMGGQLALDAAVTAPDRVAGLVLITPAVSGAPEGGPLDEPTRRLVERLRAARGDVAEQNRLETWLWLDGPAQQEGRVGGPARALALAMNEVALRNEVADEPGVAVADVWARVTEIRCPVTVAYGELDVPQVVATTRQLAGRLGVPAHALPSTAHLPYLEQPAAVADLVRAALPG